MSAQAAEPVLGALKRVESLFAAPDGAPTLRVQPQQPPQHCAPASAAGRVIGATGAGRASR